MVASLLSGKCLNLPTVVRTPVAPHSWTTAITMPTLHGKNMEMIVRPSLFRTLSYFSPEPQPLILQCVQLLTQSITPRWLFSVPSGQRLALGIEYISGNPQEEDIRTIKQVDLVSNVHYRLDPLKGRATPGNRVFLAQTINTVDRTFIFTLHNPTNVGWDVGTEIQYYDENYNVVFTATSATQNIPAGESDDYVITLYKTQASGGFVPPHFAFAIYLYSPATLVYVTEGNSFGLWDDGYVETESIVGTEFSVLRAVSGGSDVILNQFKIANSYRVTSFMAVVTNTTAQIAKGGSVIGATFPGDSYQTIPKQEIYDDYVSSRNTSYVESLDEGITWYYKPEKVQDLYFKTTDFTYKDLLYGVADLPFALLAFAPPEQTTGAPFPLGIKVTLNITVQYITPDVSSAQFYPAVDATYFLHALLAAWGSAPNFSRNADHWETIKRFAMSVARNPAVQGAFKMLATEAVTGLIGLL